MHTRLPPLRPFQISANPPEANAISPFLVTFSESMQERGRMLCVPQTLRRIRTLFLRRSSVMFGASKAYARGSIWVPRYPLSADLVENVDENQGIVALQ